MVCDDEVKQIASTVNNKHLRSSMQTEHLYTHLLQLSNQHSVKQRIPLGMCVDNKHKYKTSKCTEY